jgi:hypothetical protein
MKRMTSRLSLPPNQALQRTAPQQGELQASVRGRRLLTAGSLGDIVPALKQFEAADQQKQGTIPGRTP